MEGPRQTLWPHRLALICPAADCEHSSSAARGRLFSQGVKWGFYNPGCLGSDLLRGTHLLLSGKGSITLHRSLRSDVIKSEAAFSGRSLDVLECPWLNQYLFSVAMEKKSILGVHIGLDGNEIWDCHSISKKNN